MDRKIQKHSGNDGGQIRLIHIPVATYRIQFTPDFTFEDMMTFADYLRDLGISDLYASPVFTAQKGSSHGYDIVSMNEINPELGGMEGFEKLNDLLKERGISWLQDIVPNHRAFDGRNHLLMDVLEKGPESDYYRFFDIDWDHPYENIRKRILAPFLGDFYANCLERGEIQLSLSDTGFSINYYEHSFPLALKTYSNLLRHNIGDLKSRLGEKNPDVVKLLGIINFADNLEEERKSNPDFNFGNFLKEVLWNLYNNSEQIRRHIDSNICEYNGESGNSESFNLLDDILSEQYFRLSYWKVGTEELNYRRFFSINDLICLRVEDEEVFSNTHQLVFRLIEEGRFHGVRIDHIDGLFDPSQYINRLRKDAPEIYIVAEKILEKDENLPFYWPLHGTTGYDFLAWCNNLFVDADNGEALERIYRDFSGFEANYDHLVTEKKRNIIGNHMAGDIDNLALMLKEIANRKRQGNDLTLYGLRRAMVEILTQFPIYRTYVNQEHFSERDRNIFRYVIDRCKDKVPQLVNELDLIRDYFLGEFEGAIDSEDSFHWRNFIMRLQQYTGPLMAKGVEDTVFYIYNRHISLNEVGDDPSVFGVSRSDFHDFIQERAVHWPNTMNTTSTHDTKRGEDARARINVISENPHEWQSMLSEWRGINQKYKKSLETGETPSGNDEYLLYQTLIAAMPFSGPDEDNFTGRIKNYMIKASREAKVYTSWLRPDNDYENGLLEFIDSILDVEQNRDFLDSFLDYQKKIAGFGILNSLSQVTIKLTCPGVPDLYQGSELWDLSLVDPDNRRPVDYVKRKNYLEEITTGAMENAVELTRRLMNSPEDGKIKMFLIHRLLEARKMFRPLFSEGGYQPLEVNGELEHNIIAFQRINHESSTIVVAARFFSEFMKEPLTHFPESLWKDACINISQEVKQDMYNIITEERLSIEHKLPLRSVLCHLPVAVLVAAGPK